MMRIQLHKHFKKRYKKLRVRERAQFQERRDLFLKDPFHPIFHNHPLRGKYKGYRSINISGDLRLVFKELEDRIVFADIGTHHELFGS